MENSAESYSQLKQDIFVLNILNKKRNGYFVDIGAGNGKFISNTYLLEKEYDWNGVLCEPNYGNIQSIKKIRSVPLETLPIWSESNQEIDFLNCEVNDLSGIESCFNEHTRERNIQNIIKLQTISLNDLLEKYNAPTNIDYISIDTEGSEYEIIKNLNFKKYNISIFSIEHNTPWRKDGILYLEKIKKVMDINEYYFVPNDFDCYFVNKKFGKIKMI